MCARQAVFIFYKVVASSFYTCIVSIHACVTLIAWFRKAQKKTKHSHTDPYFFDLLVLTMIKNLIEKRLKNIYIMYVLILYT